MSQPIDLYYWTTPNGWKVSILLEELGLPYNVKLINIGKGDQFDPEFLKISPNNKMPAIVDPEGPDGKPISIFESGAILLYLAEKTGKFLSKDPRKRWLTIEWLMFQMGGLGPMLGQAHHFRQYAPEKIEYGINRYTNEATRLYKVMDKRLGEAEYFAEDYSIADMAIYPWVIPYERQGQKLEDYPNLKKWFEKMQARPAVQKGVALMKDETSQEKMDEKAKSLLFGNQSDKIK